MVCQATSHSSRANLYQEGAGEIPATKLRDAILKHASKGDDFRLSKLAGDTSNNFGNASEVFNALDSIDKSQKIATDTAYFDIVTIGIFKGIQVDFNNGYC
jgi:hypothetical protein